ncbi:MAG: Aldehyde dehydrogenase [uncultured Sulfurovum sp.]|uniref:Aldehyde dehydrogenase n=1 Tax=uncultured Sulfurovum sp. TaxID=269237 RepID=A0A6S6T5W7_9BACT|nr:MAG: Aldehyde dehydrogenase [uncultured Sulfurovum sp.]
MFGIFHGNPIVKDAKIYMGSKEEIREEMMECKNAYMNAVVTRVPLCSVEDTKCALKIAKSAVKETKSSSLEQRISWLEDVANVLEVYREDMAQTLVDEVSKPITFARIEVDKCVETIRLIAQELLLLDTKNMLTSLRENSKTNIGYFTTVPLGVVVCITPYTFPLNLVAHQIAPALAVGNAVVLKPTSEAGLTAYKLAKIFNKSKFAIKDALSVVYGDFEVSNTLIKSSIPTIISFMGSVSMENIIKQQAGIKKVKLELRGNTAIFIDDSADIKYAASRCVVGAFVNSGQVSIPLQHIYVHAFMYEEFAKAMVRETKKINIGSPYEEDTFMGSLINQESMRRAISWVESAQNEGAKLLIGAVVLDDIFHPTVLSEVRDDMKVLGEEVFAPIVSLIKVKSDEEVISKMNDNPDILQCSIFTNNLNRIQKFIDDVVCEELRVNDVFDV